MSDPVTQEGVILRKIPYGEADEIVTALLREDGVRRLFVAGSRKSRKRFCGLVDVFAHLQFECRPNDAGLWRLQSVDEIVSAAPTSSRFWERDIRTYAYFSYVAELICECVPEAMHAVEVFEIWREATVFFALNEFSLNAAAKILLKLWAAFGYEMTMETNASCDVEDESRKILKSLISFSHTILQKYPKAEEFLLQVLN